MSQSSLPPSPRPRILVAMSGGIDSSAVCLMLQAEGYEVVGMTMRVFDLPGQFEPASLSGCDEATLRSGRLPGEPAFIKSAKALADRLGIAHYVADVREEFRRDVVSHFIDEYASGRTPNPCVRCNRHFKFRLMAEYADRLSCPLMATGHYVQTETDAEGHVYLLRGADAAKDQSYFLWRVPQDVLRRCRFPLGGMHKTEVRRYLATQGYEAKAGGKESMEVCFVEGDYRDFLEQHAAARMKAVDGGAFVDTAGRQLGCHRGVPFYTVGQRKGLGIALGTPAYVVRLNAAKNTVVLGTKADLLASAFFVSDATFVSPRDGVGQTDLTVRIRYHSDPVACRVEPLDDGRLLVRTPRPVSAVSPGQSAVFYVGNRLVGGAVIDSQRGIGLYTTPANYEG